MTYIQFLGAAGTVTGSKHLVNTGGFQVLVDCGLFQGQKEWRERNWEPPPIPAREIDAVVLTHAHLDHCGWIPRLVKAGFSGPIYATQPTIDLCGVLLPDSGHLQEEDAAYANKKKSSRHSPALPLYTEQEALDCLRYFQPIGVGEVKRLNPDFTFSFVRAAHILGSAMAEVTVRAGGGPHFLEYRTYRFRAHSMYDPELYRDKQEVEEWKKRDPIPNLIERLKQQNLWQEEELSRMEGEVAREIQQSVEFAEAGRWEPVEELTRFVYSEGSPAKTQSAQS